MKAEHIVDVLLEGDPDEIDPRQAFKDLYTWQSQLDYFGYKGERNGAYYFMQRVYPVPNSDTEGMAVGARVTNERLKFDSPEGVSFMVSILYQKINQSEYVGSRHLSIAELPTRLREFEQVVNRYGDRARLYDQLVSWLHP